MFRIRMADCAAIVNELDVIDWFSLFSEKNELLRQPVLRDGLELL
jgi:hypothetical protein